MTGKRIKLRPEITEQVVVEEARRYYVEVEAVRRRTKRTKRPVFFCRIAITKRLYEMGASTLQIADVLDVDSSTVSYYLGNHSRAKPTKPKWKRPRVVELSKVRKPQPPAPKRYKIPYAGADYDDYQWQERA